MNYPYYISQTLRQRSSGSFTRLILGLAFWGVALSVAIMLISFATVTGFKNSIIEKVTGFDGDLYIKKFDTNRSLEASYFSQKSLPIDQIKALPWVDKVRILCTKAGIIRHQGEMEGLMFKGVDSVYQDGFIRFCMKKGQFPTFNESRETYQLVISSRTASKLQLDTGMFTEAIFIQDGRMRRRKFSISGIYNSGLAEHDELYAFCDIRVVQRIVSLGYDSINSAEVLYVNTQQKADLSPEIRALLPLDLKVETASEANFNLFEWLNYLDTNVLVILVLMFFVSAVNMLSAIVVLIIERTRMIGILKALGASTSAVLKIFWYFSLRLAGRGIIAGNLIAWSVILLQWETSVLKLDETIYYLDKVPFELSALHAILINVAAVLVCALVLLIPVGLIQKVSPSKTLRFE